MRIYLNKFNNIMMLNKHQRVTKYCLVIQGKIEDKKKKRQYEKEQKERELKIFADAGIDPKAPLPDDTESDEYLRQKYQELYGKKQSAKKGGRRRKTRRRKSKKSKKSRRHRK